MSEQTDGGKLLELAERMAAAIELGHETLHQCTAVLSANDCATVAKAMLKMRQTLSYYRAHTLPGDQ